MIYWRTKRGVLVVEQDAAKRVLVRDRDGQLRCKVYTHRAATGGFHGLLWLHHLTPAGELQ